jgi:Mg2+ and Co2+ transporter CorA
MLVARQSFSYVDSFDRERKAVHRGITRVAESHELARRFSHRFEPVRMREEAASRFRHVLDRVDSYDEYRSTLDKLTARLELVERVGEVRCGGRSLTDVFR